MEDLIHESLRVLANGDDYYDLNIINLNSTLPNMNSTQEYNSSHDYIYCLIFLVVASPCLCGLLNWYFKEINTPYIIDYFIPVQVAQSVTDHNQVQTAVLPVANLV